MSKNSLEPRKQPTQKRAKDKVNQIFNATFVLLEKEGVEGITALKIAQEAKIPVATVYQYFPNTKAVIAALYQKWLNMAEEKLDQFEAEYLLKIPMDQFFINLGKSFYKGFPFSHRLRTELFYVSEIYPGIRKIKKTYSLKVADKIAGYLKQYEVDIPEKNAKLLGLFIFQVSENALQRAFEQDEETADRFISWMESMIIHLIQEEIKKQ